MVQKTSSILAGLCFLMFSLSSAPNMGNLYKVEETKEQNKLKTQDEEPKVELLYFGATWCPPC